MKNRPGKQQQQEVRKEDVSSSGENLRQI